MNACRWFTPGLEHGVRPPPLQHPQGQELFDLQNDLLHNKRLAKRGTFDHLTARASRQQKFFLLIPPLLQYSLSDLMSRVELADFSGKAVKGRSAVDPDARDEDTMEVPSMDSSYMLEGVDYGRDRMGTSPRKCAAEISKEGRRAFTMRQGIVLAILFPDVLRQHYLEMAGSLVDGCAPGIYTVNFLAVLSAVHTGSTHFFVGSPSCERIEC